MIEVWLFPIGVFLGIASGWLAGRTHPAPVDLDALATVTREQFTAGYVAGYNTRLDEEKASKEAAS